MSIIIFSLLILALVAFFFYKAKGLLPASKNTLKKGSHLAKVTQLAKKGDDTILIRSTKFKLDELQSGYTKLSGLLIHNCSVETVDALFSTISEVKSKEVKSSDQGLHYLLELLNLDMKGECFYFFSLDWKAGIEDLHHHIQKRLSLNEINASLPNVTNYPDSATVSYKGVFKDYTYALNQAGLGLGFVRNPTDTYILFIYRLDESDSVYWALSHVGLNIEPYRVEWDD